MRAKAYRVRRCACEETRKAARVCAEAFSKKPELRLEALQGLAQAMADRRRLQVEEDLEYMFARAASRKREATIRTKLKRTEGEIAQLKMSVARSGRALARAKLERARWEREAKALWFQRQWICLVVEHCSTGKLIGCVTISMRQVESLLPPPFPSNAPWRLYLSNMAVDQEFRRQGVARALLHESERLARRWHAEDMWLHVEEGNQVAEELYIACGFARKNPGSNFLFRRQHLLYKTLECGTANPSARLEGNSPSGWQSHG